MASITPPPGAATPRPVSLAAVHAELSATRAAGYVFAVARLFLGWMLLCTFFDKALVLGLGAGSGADMAGADSPARGLTGLAALGMGDGVRSVAGAAWVERMPLLGLFGLLAVGLALIAGIGLRLAAAAGTVLSLLAWTVLAPPQQHVPAGDHLVLPALLIALALVGAGDTIGFGRVWARTGPVRGAPWLR